MQTITITLQNEEFKFRKLSTMDLAMKIGLPIPREDEDSVETSTKYLIKLLNHTAVNQKRIHELNMLELSAIMADPQIQAYFQEIVGERTQQ